MFIAGGPGVLPGLAVGVWKIVLVCGRVLFSFVLSFHFFPSASWLFPFLFFSRPSTSVGLLPVSSP